MDSFGYLIPKSGPVADSNMGDLLSVHLEISCPSARNDLSAYLESGVSVDSDCECDRPPKPAPVHYSMPVTATAVAR